MKYLFSIINMVFLITGIIVIVFAERLSMVERRMVDKHPGTRLTGWSGTRRGTMSWRLVGLLLVMVGVAQEVHSFIRK